MLPALSFHFVLALYHLFISLRESAYQTLQVQRNYYLVSLVDNDYVHGDLFAAFRDV